MGIQEAHTSPTEDVMDTSDKKQSSDSHGEKDLPNSKPGTREDENSRYLSVQKGILLSKWIGYQVVLRLGTGMSFQQPPSAAQVVLSDEDLPLEQLSSSLHRISGVQYQYRSHKVF